VIKNFSGQADLQLYLERYFGAYLQFHCDDCGSNAGYHSRPRTFSERYLLPLLLLQPVRCGECFRRDYRLIFVPIQNRLTLVGSKPAASVAASSETRSVA
jgi:hypothetical protein